MRFGDFSAKKFARVTALLITALPLVSSSQTSQQINPQTKWPGMRQGFNLFSPEQEIEIGRNSVIAVEKYLTPLSDTSVNEYISRLAQTLIAQPAMRRFPYNIKLINSPAADAFAFPGGTVYLTRGMIETARSEGELAGVIAHEIAHIELRHGACQASKAYLAQAGLGVLGGIAGEVEVAKIVGALGGFGFNTIFLKYSPEAEMEANALGARILASAGYDSREMTNFFQALRRRARGDAPMLRTFLDDHPSDYSVYHPAGGTQVEQKDREVTPLRGTQRAVGDFQRIQTYIAGLPRVSNPSPVARRRPTVMEEAAPDRPAINARFERPSSHSRDYWQPGGFWFQVAYPENWRAYPSGDKLGVTFIPPGGVIEARGQTQLIYGAVINRYRPIGDNSLWTGLRRRSFRYIGGRGELVEATNDLLDSVLQNNPHLDFARGSDRRGSKNGLTAITLTLTGRSPSTGRDERVKLYTSELDDGDVVYAIFVAPDDEYGDFRPAFERMLRGLKIDDGALQRGR
ncbi:MAG TPA: M48 family metalloprotease [Blastocatellia bacterium]|nr:M48 family metalloprotease [Blastocatellia bacterium]